MTVIAIDDGDQDEGGRAAPFVAERPWPTAAERAQGIATLGPALRTGLSALDALCRGGVRWGSFVIVAGPPGASKTSLVTDLVGRWAEAGHPILFLAADEATNSILVRLGQQRLGLHREFAENGIENDAIAAWCRDHPNFEIVDVNAHDETLDEILAAWDALIGDEVGIVVADSIQTLADRPCELIDAIGPAGTRERITAIIGTLRATAATGHVVIGLSEVARSHYRSRSPRDQADPLSAVKESGAGEYRSDLLAVLKSVSGSHDLIDATIAKNRIGQRGEFRLRRDPDRCSFEDIGDPGENELDTAADAKRDAARIDAIRESVISVVRKHRLKSKTSIARLASGRKADVLATFDLMIAERAIEKRDGVFVVVDKGNQR